MCWGSSICCLLEMRVVNHIALILLIIPDGHNALSGSNLWVVLISHLHTFYLPDLPDLVTLGAWRWAKLSGGHTLTPIACLCRKHEKCLLSATNSIRHFPVTWSAKDSKRKMWPKIKFRINVTPPLRPWREMDGSTLRESSFHVRNENQHTSFHSSCT